MFNDYYMDKYKILVSIEEEQTTQCPKEKVKYIVCFEDTDHQSGILR
jgi:hypothetical protein